MTHPDSACHNCGSRIEQYSRFCRNCGVPVNREEGAAQQGLDQKTTRMDRPEFRVPRWRLSKVEGINIPDGFPLKAQARIGRDPHCEIHLPSTNVSRYHAQVEWTGTGFDITDLNSTNGTYVNRRLIKEATRLKIGSSIQIGEYTFLVMKDTAQCGTCRETVRSDDRFCQYCGSPLIEKEFHPPPSAAEHTHEEPFPETTPVPAVTEEPGGTSTPKFNAPLPAEIKKSQETSREKPPPPPAPVQTTAKPSRAPAPPPKPPPPPRSGDQEQGSPQHKPKPRRSFWRTCFLLLLTGFGSLVVLGVIGYALFATGTIQRRTFLNISTGEISVTNLSNATLTARLSRLDTESGSPETFGSTELASLEIGGIAYIEAGRYQLEITGTPTTGACNMRIEARDQYSIVVVDGGIAIAKEGYQPTDPNELDLALSSLCRQ